MFLADKKQPYGKLILDSFRAFKPLFKKILPVYVIQVVVLCGLSYLIFGTTLNLFGGTVAEGMKFVIGTIILYVTDDTLSTISTTEITKILYGGEIFSLDSFFIFCPLYTYFSINMFFRGDGVLSNDQNKITGSWVAGVKRFLPALGYALFIYAIFSTLFFASGILFMIILQPHTVLLDGKFVEIPLTAAERFISLSVPVLIVFLFIFFLVRFFYSYPLLVSHQKGVFAAIDNSFRLTKGYFWRIFGMYIIVLAIPSFAFGLLYVLFVTVIPAGTVKIVIVATIATIVLIKNFVLTVLTIGAAYVFLNDSIHHHDNSDGALQPANTDSTVQQDSIQQDNAGSE